MKRKKKASRTKDVLLADLWDNFTKFLKQLMHPVN